MSRSVYIVCMKCREYLWIGQNETFYSGEPHTMEALKQFLIKHRTYQTRDIDPDNYHELIYTPEPWNGGVEEYLGGEWTEIDSDDYTPPLHQELSKTERE